MRTRPAFDFLPVLLIVHLALVSANAADPAPFWDREFPLADDITATSDTGPQCAGIELAPANLLPNGDFERWSERRVEVNPGLPGEEGLWETWLMPEGWTYHHWSGKDFTAAKLQEKTHRYPVLASFQAKGAHSGQSALNVGFGEPGGWLWFGSDMIKLEPGREYVLSLWVKAQNVGRGIRQFPYPLRVLLRLYADPKREHLTGVRAFWRMPKVAADLPTFDWRLLQWQFTAPPGAEWATLQLQPNQARGDFSILVDDVSLRQVVREPTAWVFERNAGLGNVRRDNLALGENGLELAKVINLAPNGGFEADADGNAVPDDWVIQKAPAGASLPEDPSLAAALDRTAHSGERGLKLSGTTGTVCAVSRLVELKDPGPYTLSVYYKSPPRTAEQPYGYGTISIRLPMDGTVYSRNTVQVDNAWLRETITFTYPGRTRPCIPPYKTDPGIEIALSYRGNGAIWFDDVQLEPARTPSRLASAVAVYADRGEGVSEIIALGFAQSGSISWAAEVPEKRLVQVSTRTGFTPYYDRAAWTDWSQPYAEAKGSPLDLQVVGVPLYLQWRVAMRRDDPKIVTEDTLVRSYAPVVTVPEWRYCFDAAKDGVKQGFAGPDLDDSAWKTTAGLQGPTLPEPPAGFKDGVVWHRARVALPASAKSAPVFLRLAPQGGLTYSTKTSLYVNGVEAKTRLGAAAAWLCVSHVAKPGETNCLVLRIEGQGSDRADYLNGASIIQDASAADTAMKVTPVLRAVRIAVTGPRDRWAQPGDAQITALRNGEIRPPLMPFRPRTAEDYEKDPKLRALRTLAREITQDVPDEDTRMLRLRKHLYTLCNATGTPNAYQLQGPNNQTYDFLHLAVQDRLSMYCSHHWLTLTDLATAVGFVVRPVTTGSFGPCHFWADNVVEYWSDQHNKWVMVNTFFDNYFTRGGVPQSAADLMTAWFDDRWNEIESRAGGDISNTFRYSAEQAIGPFGWQASPPHTHANSHGWVDCVYVTDNPAHGPGVTLIHPGAEPFFIGQDYWTGSFPYTTAEYELYAPINQTLMRLEFKADACVVNAEQNMPNFEFFQSRVGADGGWQRVAALPLTVPLQPGPGEIHLRAVNRFGIAGPESHVLFRITRPFAELEETTLPAPPAPAK